MLIKNFIGRIKIPLGLLHVTHSLPKWSAVELTFFAPWEASRNMTTGEINIPVIPQQHSMHTAFKRTLPMTPADPQGSSTNFPNGGSKMQVTFPQVRVQGTTIAFSPNPNL